ncbi:MAG: UDP-3-O-acyl-N-acetylglucosamine deacetylase, partial [Puniceicoccales bacterium]|nr:UDP-3-O-acyl-N-acetylglucosamine deacetylase [Puniceicoccales bacterium]
MPQCTIAREVCIRGTGLHTGENVTLTLRPAPAGTGLVFRRIDLEGSPEIRARVEHVTDIVRGTTLSKDVVKISTVEHVLSALNGMAIDNAYIQLDGSEPPILDGSTKPYVELIQSAGIVTQE